MSTDLKTIYETALTEVADRDKEGVGTLRWGGDGKCYRWVENVSTTVTFTVGQATFHDIGDGADILKKVDQPAAAEDLVVMAGIVVAASLVPYVSATVKSLHFGWVQVLGYHAAVAVINQETTVTAVGASFKGVNANSYLTEGAAIANAPLYANHVIGLEAVATVTTAATTSIKGYIKCL